MKLKLYIDSGAFSAQRVGTPIDVQQYIKFLKQHEAHIAGYMNLDVIPNDQSIACTEDAAREGWHNFRLMCAAGLDPIPVYHMGERREWLDRMLNAGCTHIGLGGVARVKDEVRKQWLDEVFAYLCGSQGYPISKIHGFGITSMPLVYRYPWATTDSISWFTYSNYGFAALPRTSPDGSPDYSKGPQVIGFSRGSVNGNVHKAHLAGQHYDVLGGGMKNWVDAYLTREGFKVKDLHTDWNARDAVTVRYFKRAAENHPMRPYRTVRNGLLGSKDGSEGTDEAPTFDLMFTVNVSADRSQTLTDEGVKTRLLSFYYFAAGKTPVDIANYASTGLIQRKERSKC